MSGLTGVVIGCGAIGREHIAALVDLNIHVAALCDLSPARAEAAAERYGIMKWYTDYRRLLEETRPNVVHIATPPSAHFSIAQACLAADLNVLCEKPIVVDYTDFKYLKLLALEKDLMLIENQNLRCHSSVRRIRDLVLSGDFGEVLDVQIHFALNVADAGSPYTDQNAPHFSSNLRGGVIGDFLPHIAYLAQMFVGTVVDVRTTWWRHGLESPLAPNEFRALVSGKQATAYVAFSGTSQLNGYWLRVLGSKMYAEANLLEPPRIAFRRHRVGEPALASLLDGLAESREILRGSVAGFWRRLAGTSNYDGLTEFIDLTYRALQGRAVPPVSLDEVEASAALVDRFTQSTVLP